MTDRSARACGCANEPLVEGLRLECVAQGIGEHQARVSPGISSSEAFPRLDCFPGLQGCDGALGQVDRPIGASVGLGNGLRDLRSDLDEGVGHGDFPRIQVHVRPSKASVNVNPHLADSRVDPQAPFARGASPPLSRGFVRRVHSSITIDLT